MRPGPSDGVPSIDMCNLLAEVDARCRRCADIDGLDKHTVIRANLKWLRLWLRLNLKPM